jgi:hypothetical protein
MGIAGTQIAEDAASIILLYGNFAIIVFAAKWDRNVVDSSGSPAVPGDSPRIHSGIRIFCAFAYNTSSLTV